jgi:hypothetical protein
MVTTHDLRRHLVLLVSTGLVLVSLWGCLTLPAASVSGIEPRAYQDYGDDRSPWHDRDDRDYRGYRGYRGPRDYRDYRGYGDDRPYPRPRYALPDRYTIHKGKKCELRCERIRGTRDYSCREYRC